jgi:hypothetical protein
VESLLGLFSGAPHADFACGVSSSFDAKNLSDWLYS